MKRLKFHGKFKRGLGTKCQCDVKYIQFKVIGPGEGFPGEEEFPGMPVHKGKYTGKSQKLTRRGQRGLKH